MKAVRRSRWNPRDLHSWSGGPVRIALLVVIVASLLPVGISGAVQSGGVVVGIGGPGDDVEELGNGWLYVGSSDLELVEDGGSQTVGLRFAGVGVPRGAVITDAWVQFTVDEVSTGPAVLRITAVDAGDVAVFSGSRGVSGLPVTAESVLWEPAGWATVGAAGVDQRTPDLSGLVQAVVDRPDWVSGHAVALVVTGTGSRVAESYEGSRAGAPVLHVDYIVGGSQVNEPPVVSAAAGSGVVAPGRVVLDGTVSDDGRPDPPGMVTVAWSQVDGPGVAVIGDPAAVDTDAVLPEPGTYTFRLTADDGEHTVTAQATVTATPPQPPGAARFAVIGDYGVVSAGAVAVAGLVEAQSVDFIVTTGDNVYGSTPIDDVVGRLYAGYVGGYRGAYGPGAPSNRFFPTLGNHDYTDAGGVTAYYDFFTLPGEGFISSSGTERYYDFVWGPVHFFVLDGYVDTTVQRAWLEHQMPRSDAPWQVVVQHFAPYTSSADHGPSDWMQWPYGAWGADLVLSGHDHQYERLLVDDGAGPIPYLVVGLGGQYIHPFGTPAPDSRFRYNADFGAVIADACDTGMRLAFHSVSDGVVDEAVIGDGCTSDSIPVAVDDEVSVQRGGSIQVGPPGVLGNDVGVDPLQATLVEPPAGGAIALHPDGRFTYSHAGGAGDSDSFRYEVVSPTGVSQPATVRITITDAAETIRFAQIGDFGDPFTGEAEVAALIASLGVDFIITTGDNVQLDRPIDDLIGAFYADYIGDYIGAYGPGAPSNRFFPSLGNHDYRDAGGVAAYFGYFTLPGEGFTSSSGTERYYDFVWGPVHFFALDSHSNIAPQKPWLEQQLAASTAPWQVVYFHFPPYSSGGRSGSSYWMQWDFEAWGADAVLAGNDQVYERLMLDIDRDGRTIPYLVNGLGGAIIHPLSTPIHGSVAQYNADHGALIVDACEAGMTFGFYSAAGSLIDRHTVGEPCSPRI